MKAEQATRRTFSEVPDHKQGLSNHISPSNKSNNNFSIPISEALRQYDSVKSSQPEHDEERDNSSEFNYNSTLFRQIKDD